MVKASALKNFDTLSENIFINEIFFNKTLLYPDICPMIWFCLIWTFILGVMIDVMEGTII